MNRFLDALAVLALVALAILTGLASLPARSEPIPCRSLADGLAFLKDSYQETPRVSGLASSGSLMVITAAPEGGWSVLMVTPDGRACLVASGTDFEAHQAEPPGIDG